MSTICVSDDNRTFVLCKGAPEKIMEFIPNVHLPYISYIYILYSYLHNMRVCIEHMLEKEVELLHWPINKYLMQQVIF